MRAVGVQQQCVANPSSRVRMPWLEAGEYTWYDGVVTSARDDSDLWKYRPFVTDLWESLRVIFADGATDAVGEAVSPWEVELAESDPFAPKRLEQVLSFSHFCANLPR